MVGLPMQNRTATLVSAPRTIYRSGADVNNKQEAAGAPGLTDFA
jgi:hypothetical protein